MGKDIVQIPLSPYQRKTTRPAQKNYFVSVIVPNYNHAAYLKQRLRSIYDQTYQNFEVLLLDDCSEDGSREILEEYRARYPDKTKTIFNAIRSKNVSEQWSRGLREASGELVWIAESDDWCTNNFLERLVGYFQDEAIMLAYCNTILMDRGGQKKVGSVQEYLFDIDPGQWQNSFIQTSFQIVRSAFGIKNIVPNASGSLFRNPAHKEVLDNERWKKLRFCVDWVFYLHIIRGGLIAYDTQATNYFRIHGENNTHLGFSRDLYYKEHEVVGEFVASLYAIPDQVLESLRENAKNQWLSNRPDYSEEKLDQLYSVSEIKRSANHRKPNLLMVYSGFQPKQDFKFSLIQLANLLKTSGYAVTFLDCSHQGHRQDGDCSLRRDIPVINHLDSLDGIIADFGIEITHLYGVSWRHPIWAKLPSQTKYLVTLYGGCRSWFLEFGILSRHLWNVCMYLVMLLMTQKWKHSAGKKKALFKSLEGISRHLTNFTKPQKSLLSRIIDKVDQFVYIDKKSLRPFQKKGLFTEGQFLQMDHAMNAGKTVPKQYDDLYIRLFRT